MQGVTRMQGWMSPPEEERLRPAEGSSRRAASTLLKSEIKTALLAKLLPPAPQASDPRRMSLEEAVTHARRHDAGLAYSLSGEGGAAVGAP